MVSTGRIRSARRTAAMVSAGVAALFLTSSRAADGPHPNVLFIQSDDHGFADVGFRGSIIDTPNLDGLAASGLILERYHTYPVCSPTRIGLMTGRNPITVGMTDNITTGQDGVPLDEHMLPQTFRAHGYQTWMMGKWHLGGSSDPRYLPQQRGFDHFYGFVGGSINETTHRTPISGLLDWQRNGLDVPEDDGLLSTDLLASEAISLITGRDPARPFFLYLSFHAVHMPYDAPQAMKDKYAERGLAGYARAYAAMAENMDRNIGRVLDALGAEGIAGETLVVFVSDNGARVDKGGSNLPLRGWKRSVLEGGHRVPAVVSWPGTLQGGILSEQFVSHVDWLPTLAAATGITPKSHKPLDGINRWPALRDGISGRPSGFVIRSGEGVTILDGDHKLLRECRSGPFQLYDVYQDPGETKEMSAERPDLVEELARFLDPCHDGSVAEYGEGCPGSGNVIPELGLDGCPAPGEQVTVGLSHARAYSVALLLCGRSEGHVPLAGACILHLADLIGGATILSLDGTGSHRLDWQIPTALTLDNLMMQAFVADEWNPWGYSSSAAVSVRFAQ